MTTFNTLETPNVVRTLAVGALRQLYLIACFGRAAVTSVDGDDLTKYFDKGELAKIKRLKNYGDAQDFDPRSGIDASTQDAQYVITDMQLERLFTQGHPTYSMDANVAQYVNDFSASIGGSIGQSFEKYLYLRGFRDWSKFPTAGTVQMAAEPPTQLVFREDSSGNMTTLDDSQVTAAGNILDKNDVPMDHRFMRVTPDAGRGIETSATLVTGFAGAHASQDAGTNIIVDGIGVGVDFMRRGFRAAKSNAVTGQLGVANIGDGGATSTVTAAVDDTTLFLAGDTTTTLNTVLRGAVKLTIGVAAALSPLVAVGTICRLGAVTSAALAYGVVIRVDLPTKALWIVPYNADGRQLRAASIPADIVFSVPAIGSVNVAYCKEHLAYAIRPLQLPPSGSGAFGATVPTRDNMLLMQVFYGSYNVHQFRGGVRGALLCGATPTDSRRAVLALSA